MLSQSDANLLPHDVHSGCRFGHRMFDLNAGVHLDKIECLILVKKLDRSSPPVADPTTRRRASPAECLDLNTRYARRRRGSRFSAILRWLRILTRETMAG